MKPATTVICTVGTSLFGNLAGLKQDDPQPLRRALAAAYQRKDWPAVAAALPPARPASTATARRS